MGTVWSHTALLLHAMNAVNGQSENSILKISRTNVQIVMQDHCWLKCKPVCTENAIVHGNLYTSGEINTLVANHLFLLFQCIILHIALK